MEIGRSDNYQINSYHADLKGQLSLPVLMHFLQETAWRNAEDMGVGYSHLLQNNLAWVLYKIYIKVEKWPLWGEEITLKTWPSKADKLFCYREFEICQNDNIIASAASSWLVIDLLRRRPVRTASFYARHKNLDQPMLFPQIIKNKMPEPEEYSSSFSNSVQTTDIDVNKHVNNAIYPTWCLNSYPLDFYRNHRISSAEQQFISEARFSQNISILTHKYNDLEYDHTIKRDDSPLYRLKLIWQPHTHK